MLPTAGVRTTLSSPGYRAGLILAVLLAHLLYMATPFHDARLGEQPATQAVATSAGGGHSPVGLESASHHEHDGHCVIAWTSASRASTAVVLHVVAFVGTSSGLELHLTMAPIARAIGPPADGDAQALLQVFRL